MAETQEMLTKPSIDTSPVENIKAARLDCTLLSDKQVELTQARAYEILELKTFKGERNVDDRHVQELYDEMAAGRFRAEHVRIALCKLGDQTYRLNGQHTCWARTYMPKNYACQVRELVYQVENEDNLKKLYTVFDPSCAARSIGHLTRILLLDTPAAGELSQSIVGAVATGFKFWRWGDSRSEYRRQGPNEVAQAVQSHAELFRAVAEFYFPFDHALHIRRRQGVIAAMFECWDRKPTFASQFWRPVCDGLGLQTKTDAKYMLMRYLQSHSLDKTNRVKNKQFIDSETMYRTCINTWNRWRAGETEITTIRSTSKRVAAK